MMVLEEMVLELFDNLGRPTDLSPLDRLDDNTTINPTLPGYNQLRRWLNQGYKAITTWRTPGGKFFRMRDLITRKNIEYGPHDLDMVFLPANPTVADESHIIYFPDDPYYAGFTPPGMVLVTLKNLGNDLEYEDVDGLPPSSPTYLESLGIPNVEGEFQNVYKTTNADWCSLGYFLDDHTIYTVNRIPWTIMETEAKVYERGIFLTRFSDAINLYAIRKLRIIGYDSTIESKNVTDSGISLSSSKKTDPADMELAPRTENYTRNLADISKPTNYYREQDYIYFDWHIDRDYTYQLEYDRVADELVELTDAPVIQQRFHVPIILWATYRGLLRYGENTDAWSISKFLSSEMTSIIKEQDLDVERLEGGFIA